MIGGGLVSVQGSSCPNFCNKIFTKNGDYILQQICIILLKEGPLQNLGEDAKSWYLIQLNIV